MASFLELILDQLLQAQAQEQLGTAPYERTEKREDRRNGSARRSCTTKGGLDRDGCGRR